MRGASLGTATLVALAALACAPTPVARLDAPDAAARYAYLRREPLRPGISVAAAYARASDARDRLARFSSRIGRMMPSSLAPARVWLRASGPVAVEGASPTALLDAWTPLGPGNIGGRTRVVRYHPARHATLYAAGVSGGIWQSDDDGGSWRPIADSLANLTVNSLAIDPRQPDVMYAGTGEGYMREDVRGTGLPLRGSGIFATRDGGASWQRLPQTTSDDFLWVNDLELGIGDSRRVYAATRTGVWRSLDAGQTWSQLLATTVRGGCLDLAIRPDVEDDMLFASCGSYEQATVYRFAAASRSSAVERVLEEPSMGRTSLAIAPSNPHVMYALAASNDSGPSGRYQQALLAVYRSDRDGAAGSWEARVRNTDATKLNTLLLTNAGAATVEECGESAGSRNGYTPMGWYVNVIAVDPRDPERVWAAGVDWFRSDDGGRTWGLASFMTGNSGSVTGAHVDQHGIAFHPEYDGDANQVVIIGNDGGVARTRNARGTVATGTRATCSASVASMGVRWLSLNAGYGVTQFYHGLPFPSGETYIGGTQDNSTLVGSDATGPQAWQAVIGGDGGYVAVNPANPQIVYGEYQWANVYRSSDGGSRFTRATSGLDPVRSSDVSPDANYLFITPLVMDPSEPARLWLGGEFLYRTINGAASWTKASAIVPAGGLVSAIAIDPADPAHVVAGTTKGDVMSSRDALRSTAATAFASAHPRDGWITSIVFDRATSGVLYATYGNFGGAHVYRSRDGGATWSEADGAPPQRLPDIPVHSIVVDPDDPSRLYLGTDLGVFVSIDGGAGWMVEETGFGPAVTEWLALLRDTSNRKRLFAFTHGRGAWRVELTGR